MRTNNDTYRSLNESINAVQNPQAALAEAMEYASALEAVILALCEELDLDPQAILEDLQTPERDYEMYSSIRKKKQAADVRKLKAKDAAEKADEENVYGKGGKVVDTRTAYNQRVNRKWTAADKKEWARTHYGNTAREIEYDDSRSVIPYRNYKR
jgi:hypothetical protein